MTTVGHAMGLLPDTYNCGLRMRRDCRERFPRYRLQRKLLVSDLGMHHGTCVTHVPWCMSGSLTRRGGENATGILGACATGNFTYLVRGPLARLLHCRIFVRGSTEHRCWIPLAKKTDHCIYMMFSLLLPRTSCWTDSRITRDFRICDAPVTSLMKRVIIEDPSMQNNFP